MPSSRRRSRPLLVVLKCLKWLKWTGLGLLGFVLLYVALAALLPRIPVHSDWRPPDRGVQLFVASNGVHTDFVVPVRTAIVDWTDHLPCDWFGPAARGCEYVVFGWGDKGFYLETPTWSDLKFSTAFEAAFFLGTSAMHVTYEWRAPETGESCRRLVVTDEQYRKLVDYLFASFQRDDAGRLRRIDHAGFTEQDRFFDAVGTYSLFHTCNSWTGAGLDAIGVKTGLWTPFEWDVLRFLPR